MDPRSLLATVVAVVATGATAAAADPPARPIVLRAARMYDGKASATVSPGVVVVEGRKIIAPARVPACPPTPR